MSHPVRLVLLLAAAWFLAIARSGPAAPAGAPTGEVSLVVLFTTDIHGALDAAEAAGGDGAGPGPGGGLLRCATVIRDLRAREPAALLLDAGDLLQGSPECFLTRGQAAMEAIATLGYDALALGNHDLDWGADQAARLYAAAGVPLLAGNALAPDRQAALSPEPFLVREVAGLRVAVVGLTSPLIPMWIPPANLEGLRFEPSVQALRRILPRVRALRPDVMILLAHQGHRPYGDDAANELNAVAAAFPDFDLILGGHTHQAVPRERLNGVAYAQAGSHGAWVGRAVIRVNPASRRVVRVETELVPVGPGTPPDPLLAERLAPLLRKTRDYLAEPAGVAACEHRPEALAGGRPSVPALLGAALARAGLAEVTLHGALSAASLPEGPVTRRRLWDLVPFENTLVLASVTAADLRLILEDNARFAGTRQARGVWGLRPDPKRVRGPAGREEPLVLADGRELASCDRVCLAVNSFDACSAGGRLPALRAVLDKPESQTRWTDLATRQILEDYIRTNSPVCVQAP